ncbi:MAG: biotin transporter BioY [Treponema sp.]|jgi:biotin transport system substrate-specific component|nr:biotin transporter BioY [Treponema sp.]
MADTGKTSKRRTIMGVTMTSLFAALIAGGAFVSVPLPVSPVPMVLQNLFIVLAGLALGPARGSAATALYLLAGALGLPVFAGAAGGIAHFAGPTGGFLIGYFFAALGAGLIAGRPSAETAFPRIAAASAAGFLIVYVPGVFRLYLLLGNWPAAFAAGLFPFLIGDAVKAVIAALIAPRMRRIMADHLFDL